MRRELISLATRTEGLLGHKCVCVCVGRGGGQLSSLQNETSEKLHFQKSKLIHTSINYA